MSLLLSKLSITIQYAIWYFVNVSLDSLQKCLFKYIFYNTNRFGLSYNAVKYSHHSFNNDEINLTGDYIFDVKIN
jgi:hypothetical protein